MDSPRIFVLFDRHGAGRVEGTTTSRDVAQAWQKGDPGYHHVVEGTLLPTLSLSERTAGTPRSAPGGFLGGAPLYVLHDRHGDGRVQGVTVSPTVAHAWQALDACYHQVIPTVLNHLDFVPHHVDVA